MQRSCTSSWSFASSGTCRSISSASAGPTSARSTPTPASSTTTTRRGWGRGTGAAAGLWPGPLMVIFYFRLSADVKYTNIVFPAQKPFTADHIRSLTKDNLEAESEGRLEAKPPLSRAAPRMSHFSTTTTDSDYLSTIPTETTDYMATYTALEGGYLDLY